MIVIVSAQVCVKQSHPRGSRCSNTLKIVGCSSAYSEVTESYKKLDLKPNRESVNEIENRRPVVLFDSLLPFLIHSRVLFD